MNALAITGLLLIIASLLLAELALSGYEQYSKLQAEADEETMECAGSVCFGLGLTAADAKMHYESSMYYLMSVLIVAPVGIVFISLNWRELAMVEN